ncbi:MAG: hypothetical protein P8R46_01865 [Planctomycetota bacterium]|nr:hypothetical protein [Planctomycetota bacterium]
MKRVLTSRMTSSLQRRLLAFAGLAAVVAAGAEAVSAGAHRGVEQVKRDAAEGVPAPLRELGRHDRAPAQPGGYVDLWGPLAPWEVRVLEGRGTTRSGR